MAKTTDAGAAALEAGHDNADVGGITLNDLLARPDHEYADEDDLEAAKVATKATQRTWACRGKGPPRTLIGRTPYYRIGALRAWLLAHETDFDAARRQPVRRGPVKRAA